FLPALLGGPFQLPVKETGAEPLPYRNRLPLWRIKSNRPIRVYCKCQRLGNHPSFTVVQSTECIDAYCFEVCERFEGEDGMAEFGVLVLVDTPEAFGIEVLRQLSNVFFRIPTISKNPYEIIVRKTVKFCDDGIQNTAEAEALVGSDRPKGFPAYIF